MTGRYVSTDRQLRSISSAEQLGYVTSDVAKMKMPKKKVAGVTVTSVGAVTHPKIVAGLIQGEGMTDVLTCWEGYV
jgi:hypothetical protein